jgi:hypothetical protein
VTPAAPDTALDAASDGHACILSVLQHVADVLGDASADHPALSCIGASSRVTSAH